MPFRLATGISIASYPTPQREMIFRFAAASEPRTSAVNLSMLANTASIPGSNGSSASAGSGPNLGGITTSHPALRSKSSAPAPTSPSVRAVIRTFQDIQKTVMRGSHDSIQTALRLRLSLTYALEREELMTSRSSDDGPVKTVRIIQGVRIGHYRRATHKH